MSCTTCKKKNVDIDKIINSGGQKKTSKSIKDYTLKFLLFLVLMIVVTPLMIPIFIVVLFRMVVLSKELNLLPIVLYLGKKIFKDEDDDDDDDDEDEEVEDGLNEDDYELVDENEIIVLK